MKERRLCICVCARVTDVRCLRSDRRRWTSLAVQEIGTSSESRLDSPFFRPLSLSLSHMFSSPLKSISGDLSSPSRRGAGQDSSALIFLCNAAKILFILQNPVTYSFIYRRLTVINFSANQICNSKGNYQHRLPTFIFVHWNYFNAARINSVNNLE